MASGRDWCGKKTAECKVGYGLGEGKSSLLKRVQAWITHNEPTPEELIKLDLNFRTTFEVPQLASKASVDNMLADLEKENFHPDVIAIDTFARSMVGLDENDAKDTGLWIESADRLRQLGFGVIFLHHTKKNILEGQSGVVYRGSSAIMGAMDTAMTLQRTGGSCTLTITKQKDHDEGAPMTFNRLIMFAGTPNQSCVLIPKLVLDSRYSEDNGIDDPQPFELVEDVLPQLLGNDSYKSDRARADALSNRTGISWSAAQSRVSRASSRQVDIVTTLHKDKLI